MRYHVAYVLARTSNLVLASAYVLSWVHSSVPKMNGADTYFYDGHAGTRQPGSQAAARISKHASGETYGGDS